MSHYDGREFPAFSEAFGQMEMSGNGYRAILEPDAFRVAEFCVAHKIRLIGWLKDGVQQICET